MSLPRQSSSSPLPYGLRASHLYLIFNPPHIFPELTTLHKGLLIIFGLFAFLLAHQENFNWHFLAARAMAVIPLGVFAAYAAHKAEQHRQIERNSRKMELELAAINPYLAALPDETQHEVKRLLAAIQAQLSIVSGFRYCLTSERSLGWMPGAFLTH